jgi:diacylglycerol kinase (ATP)
VRALAILGPTASARDLQPLKLPGAELLTEGMPPAADAVLIFGGDGTLHRQLPRLADTRIPLLVVPLGSGNDFARALGLRTPADSLAAWRRFCASANNVRDVDLGVITCGAAVPGRAEGQDAPQLATHNSELATYFCCVAGLGVDANANRRANAMPQWLRAHGGYALAALAAILTSRPQTITVTAPDTSNLQSSMNQSSMEKSSISWMLAFANAPNYGGGMRIAPQAELDDGLLDLVRIRGAGRLRLLQCLHRVYSGTHVSLPEVECFRAARARIESDPPLMVYADGEPIARTPITVSVAPRALRVITPA